MTENIPYKIKLCAELIAHSLFGSETNHNLTFNEIKVHLKIFFTDEEIEEAMEILIGRT
uniref:Uncharacterized protein n=1 Tax=viral metagenome TaxID=1070528 RepID=A0A6M3LWY4_9ZZZZ